MLVRGLTLLVLLQLLGTAIQALLLPMIPGAVIGMLLLFFILIIRKRVDPSIGEAASFLLRYLPLLLIPAAVSSMLFIDLLVEEWLPVTAALVMSLVLSILFTGWLMQKLIQRQTTSPERK